MKNDEFIKLSLSYTDFQLISGMCEGKGYPHIEFKLYIANQKSIEGFTLKSFLYRIHNILKEPNKHTFFNLKNQFLHLVFCRRKTYLKKCDEWVEVWNLVQGKCEYPYFMRHNGDGTFSAVTDKE